MKLHQLERQMTHRDALGNLIKSGTCTLGSLGDQVQHAAHGLCYSAHNTGTQALEEASCTLLLGSLPRPPYHARETPARAVGERLGSALMRGQQRP